MLNRHNNPRALGRNRAGVAALEFSLIAPVLFLILSGSFDASRVLILEHQTRDAARFIAISATTASVTVGTAASVLTDPAARNAMSIVYAEMPWVRAGIAHGPRSVTLSSIAFRKNTSCTAVTPEQNCYFAEVAFSLSYNGGNGPAGFNTNALRACNNNVHQIGPTDPILAPDTPLTVLRTAGITNPAPLIVVDVSYQFTPFFLNFLTGPITFWATDMWASRVPPATQSNSLQYTTYTGVNGTGPCPNL